MKIVLFGATGMVGQDVLREALLDPEITGVLTIGRRASDKSDPKLTQLTLADLSQYAPIEDQLEGYDACLYCLGISSSGMSEADYTRVTYDYTVAAAEALLRHNPRLTFVFVSGACNEHRWRDDSGF
jgi:nucleoside-diphosphate-sugar epimerase